MLFDMYLPFCLGFIFLPGSKTLIHLKSKRLSILRLFYSSGGRLPHLPPPAADKPAFSGVYKQMQIYVRFIYLKFIIIQPALCFFDDFYCKLYFFVVG